MVADGPVIQRQVVVISGSSTQSALAIPGVAGRKKRVRLLAESNVFVAHGQNPTVTDGTNGTPLGTENPEYFDIEVGEKIAVIQRV